MACMLSCPNGHPVADGNAFCHQCGATVPTIQKVAKQVNVAHETLINQAPVPPVVPPTPARRELAVTPPPPRPSTVNSSAPAPRRNSNVAIYALAGLVVLVALAAVALVLLLDGSNGDSGQTANNPITNPTLATTPAGSGAQTPVLLSDGCGSTGTSRPTTFDLQCDSSTYVNGLTWNTWDGQSATGSGNYYSGGGAAVPVTVTLAQPVKGPSGEEFSQVILTPATGSAIYWVQNSPDGPWAATQNPPPVAMPAGGKLCSGLINGKVKFGTIGGATSCGFVQSVYKAWEASGNQSPVTATSPATHEKYTNIVCTVDATQSWATCIGGRNNSAQMFFSLR